MESLRALAWIYGKLSGDATLTGYIGTRLYRAGQVPESTGFPYVTYQAVTSTDRATLSGDLLWAQVLCQVTCWGSNTPSTTLEAIMARVQAVLHKASGSVTGGVIFAARRAGIVPLPPEETGGAVFVPLCMEFRVEAQAA